MQHTEKTQRPAENKSSSQPLKIDSPNSAHEKEAESVAETVGRNGQIMGSGNSMPGQISGNPNPKNGMIAPSGVKEQINSMKGSGDKLPDTAKRMIKGRPGEMDGVRIHTSSNAAELAEAMNAKAFTVGKEIYFGQGAFETYTAEGKKTISHELSHALTNNPDNKEPVVQRLEKAGTAWGDFEEIWTEDYQKPDPDNADKTIYGFGMYMKFTGKDPTDASKIGLVQISKGYEGGHTGTDISYAEDESRKKHAVQPGDAVTSTTLEENEEGFHIDRGAGDVNPLYAVSSAKLGEQLSEGKTDDPAYKKTEKNKAGVEVERWYGAGKHGKYTKDESKEPNSPAELRDFPYHPITHGKEGGILLETAALALEGPQVGRYYGSVKWGWNVKPDGTFTPKHISVASEGAASTTFLKAANMWNADRNRKQVSKVIPLPVPKFYELKDDSADFYAGADFDEGSKSSVSKPFRVEKMVSDKTVPETHPNLIVVRVVDGKLAGVTGWIDSGALKEENITVNPISK